MRRLAGGQLAHHEVERVLGVQRLAVDRGDDVARLEAGGLGRTAGDDRGLRGRLSERVLALARRDPARAPLPWPPLPWAPLPWAPLPASASALGIHAPLSTGRPAACLMVGSMVSKRTPSHGRLSACPADAWASSGRAMLIGMAKPMPWLLPATAVLMPTTLPLASSSGPPLLPGLIAVSVWIRLSRWPPSTSMLRPSAEMMPLVTESENWPSGLPMAIACWPTWMVDESPIGAVGRPVCVDLDDGEVGEGVDAVDRGVERAAVLERDRQLRRVALDDVVVGEDQAVRVEDHAAADRRALAGLAGRGIGGGDALGGDRDDGRADGLDDVDERAALAGGRLRGRAGWPAGPTGPGPAARPGRRRCRRLRRAPGWASSPRRCWPSRPSVALIAR